MNFACPACAGSLAETIPRSVPGWRWSLKRLVACPHCGEALVFNWHPLERLGQGALLAVICAGVMLDFISGDVRWLLTLGGVALLGELLLMGWQGRRLAAWSRYRRSS